MVVTLGMCAVCSRLYLHDAADSPYPRLPTVYRGHNSNSFYGAS